VREHIWRLRFFLSLIILAITTIPVVICVFFWRGLFWKRISVEQDMCERAIISALKGMPLCMTELKNGVQSDIDKKYARHFFFALSYLVNDKIVKKETFVIQEHPCSLARCSCRNTEATGIKWRRNLFSLTGMPRKRWRKKPLQNTGIVWGKLLDRPT